MTSTSLEKLRQQYQDIEEKRKQAVHLMQNPPKTIKEEAYCIHHKARLSSEIKDLSLKILTTLSNGLEKSDDPISSFYSELERRIVFHQEIADKEVDVIPEESKDKPLHETSMNDLVLDIKGSVHLSLFYDNDRYQEWRRQKKGKDEKKNKKRKRIVVPETDEALTKFSGEECYGQYLDMCELHRNYLALSGPKERISYLDFLEKINSSKNNFDFIPRTPQGQLFLQDSINYLASFLSRTDPFIEIKPFIDSIINNFWNKQKMLQKQQQQSNIANNECHCPFCDRTFDTKDLLISHFNQKSHKKNENRAKNLGGLENLIDDRNRRKMKYDELSFTFQQLLEHLREKLVSTIENTKRRQTLTAAVMEAEVNLDAPIVFDESDDEDEQHFYNPKGLPLGWDGKPIPYWLYKLHGLSVEYKCEICGNKSYWGALAFERHFFDNKHVNGLKALGIPATRHFLYVTGVNEALQLYDKIKKSLSQEVWQAGDEEIETEDGQVMSYKIYRDLTKQGIIKQKLAKPK